MSLELISIFYSTQSVWIKTLNFSKFLTCTHQNFTHKLSVCFTTVLFAITVTCFTYYYTSLMSNNFLFIYHNFIYFLGNDQNKSNFLILHVCNTIYGIIFLYEKNTYLYITFDYSTAMLYNAWFINLNDNLMLYLSVVGFELNI